MAGDALAHAAFLRLGRYLGVGLTTIVNLFNPAVVTIGGGTAQASGTILQAAATLDGLIEAAEVPGQRYVIGVQWHPEDRLQCEPDRKLFESFARAVRDK